MNDNLTMWQRFVKFFNSWTGSVIFVLLLLFFVMQNFIIPSGSMIKTLLIGDMLFVKKFSYGIPTPHIPWLEIPLIPGTDGHILDGDTPQRGDIVIFRYPKNVKQHYVKRCVAIGGDELYVMNKDLYLHHHEGNEYITTHFKGYTIVDRNGKLFVKNPYMKKHPGIWHDEKVSRESLTIPAHTLINGNTFVRVQGDDIYVHFPEKDMQKSYKKEELIEFMSKLWVKNPKDYKFTKKDYAQAINDQGVNPDQQFVDYDMSYSEQVFEFLPEGQPFRVPENEYFMMGDNRDHSADSRFWGTVPYGLVEGTPWFIYFSIADDYSIRWDRVGTTVEELESRLSR